MILHITRAEYLEGYKILLTFNNGESFMTDLERTVLNDSRKIFLPLRNLDYFKNFRIGLNTITWENEADFAPEYLLELGRQQQSKILAHP